MNLTALFRIVLTLSLMGSVVAAIVFVVKGLFRSKFSATWHYYIWLLLIIRVVVPYTPESSLSIFNLVPQVFQKIELSQDINERFTENINMAFPSDGALIYVNTNINTDDAENQQIKGDRTSSQQKGLLKIDYQTLSIIWMIGAALMFLYVLIINAGLYLRTRSKPQCKEEDVIKILERCESVLGISNSIPIIYDSNLKTPALCGFIRPRLLISPGIIKELSEDEKQYVFLHELAHIKRKDILANWILALVQSLHWFNPVIWYTFYKIREDCEVACDAYVLSRLKPVEYKKYGETIINLLSMVSKPYWPSVTAGMANSRIGIKRRIKMIAMFNKNSWKWSIVAAALLIGIGIVSLTSAKGVVNPGDGNEISGKSADEGAIIIDELRTVIPDALEVTRTVSDYAHGQHIIWVEGRYKSSDGELYLSFINDSGQQLESGIRKPDEIKPSSGGWIFFSHKLIEETGKITYTKNATIIFHLKQDGKNVKGVLDVPAKNPKGLVKEPEDKQGSTKEDKNWEVVGRADRVQGIITNIDMAVEKLNSISLKVTKRIILPSNPIAGDYAGQTFEIVFNEDLVNKGSIKDKLKNGEEIVVTYAQYAILPEGKVVLGANLSDIYYVVGGKYYDINGNAVDLVPSSDSEFTTKPQVEVPVDLAIAKNDQQQVDQGHSPWQLDPLQVAMTFVSLKISPTGIKGPFPVQMEDLKVIKKTDKLAIVEVSGDKTPVGRVYLKRLVRQDDTGIWSVVGYDPKAVRF